jgi:hypothetical protein
VTVLTSAPAVASGLFHSAADIPTRRRFARGGGETATSAVLASWADGAALIRSTLTDEERRHHLIGDCVAARRASLAIYEGRRLGRSL